MSIVSIYPNENLVAKQSGPPRIDASPSSRVQINHLVEALTQIRGGLISIAVYTPKSVGADRPNVIDVCVSNGQLCLRFQIAVTTESHAESTFFPERDSAHLHVPSLDVAWGLLRWIQDDLGCHLSGIGHGHDILSRPNAVSGRRAARLSVAEQLDQQSTKSACLGTGLTWALEYDLLFIETAVEEMTYTLTDRFLGGALALGHCRVRDGDDDLAALLLTFTSGSESPVTTESLVVAFGAELRYFDPYRWRISRSETGTDLVVARSLDEAWQIAYRLIGALRITQLSLA